MTESALRDETAGDVALRWMGAGASAVLGTGWFGLLFTVLGAGAGVAVALILPKQYTSTASFIAQGTSPSVLPAALQGLALSVGLGSARDFSPQFYADLLSSRPVLMGVVNHRFHWPQDDSGGTASYADIEQIHGDDTALVREAALRRLGRRIQTRADPRTNIITVAVMARSPQLSRDVTLTLLRALDSMNIGFRQKHSRELRQFFEGRVQDAEQELAAAEGALRGFLERNRVTEGSPLLQFEQLRLTREAELKRTVYVTVVQQYEEAKLQEARNVPILTVLAPPSIPVKKSAPPRRLIVVVGALLGFLVVPTARGLGELARRVIRPQGGAARSFAGSSRTTTSR